MAPDLYKTLDRYGYAAKGSAYFSDITLGCNGVAAGAPLCAKRDYDLTSGIGSLASGYDVARSFALGPIVRPHR